MIIYVGGDEYNVCEHCVNRYKERVNHSEAWAINLSDDLETASFSNIKKYRRFYKNKRNLKGNVATKTGVIFVIKDDTYITCFKLKSLAELKNQKEMYWQQRRWPK